MQRVTISSFIFAVGLIMLASIVSFTNLTAPSGVDPPSRNSREAFPTWEIKTILSKLPDRAEAQIVCVKIS
jgi:hypothetical protein